jgi:hypothetical protein
MPYPANVTRFLWTDVVVFVSTACSTFFLSFQRNGHPPFSVRLNLVVVDAEVNGRRKLVFISYCRSVFMIDHNPYSLPIDNKWGHFPSRSTQHRPKPNSLWKGRQHFSLEHPNKLMLHDCMFMLWLPWHRFMLWLPWHRFFRAFSSVVRQIPG